MSISVNKTNNKKKGFVFQVNLSCVYLTETNITIWKVEAVG